MTDSTHPKNPENQLPTYIEDLKTPVYHLQHTAIREILQLFRNSCDIREAVPALERIAARSASYLAFDAAEVLLYYYARTSQFEEMMRLLCSPNPKIDINDLSSPLLRSLCGLITDLYVFSKSADWQHAENVLYVIRSSDLPFYTLEGFDRFQQKLESTFASLQTRIASQRGPADQAYRARVRMVQILAFASEQRSRLVREKDGELLAGETIARPKGKTGMCAVVRCKL